MYKAPHNNYAYPRLVQSYRHETFIEGVSNYDGLKNFIFLRLNEEIIGIGRGS